MICKTCKTDTVMWQGPLHNPTGTKCSNCGGINCQDDDHLEGLPCLECGDGEFAPLGEYWVCPSCDAEWNEGE